MKLVYFFLTIFFIFSCQEEVAAPTFWKITDAAVTEERIAMLIDEQPNIINILVKAETDAPFQIVASGMRENKIYQFDGGPVDTIISDYWRSKICRTRYIPKGVQTGDVNISVMLYTVEK
jgi:hypothetical protein